MIEVQSHTGSVQALSKTRVWRTVFSIILASLFVLSVVLGTTLFVRGHDGKYGLVASDIAKDAGAVVTVEKDGYARGYFSALPADRAQVVEVFTFTTNAERNLSIDVALTQSSFTPSAYGDGFYIVVGSGRIPAALVAERLGATLITIPTAEQD